VSGGINLPRYTVSVSQRPNATVVAQGRPVVASVTVRGQQGIQGPPGDLSASNIRRITVPGSVAILPTDRLITLAGPSAAVLPAAPSGVFQIAIKDDGSVAANGSVLITTQDGALIDRQSSLTFVNPGQAATLTFVAGTGWIIT
jgi:hypothetical protein